MHKVLDAITLVEMMHLKTQGVKGIIVALRNKEVWVYKGKSLINMLRVDVHEGFGTGLVPLGFWVLLLVVWWLALF